MKFGAQTRQKFERGGGTIFLVVLFCQRLLPRHLYGDVHRLDDNPQARTKLQGEMFKELNHLLHSELRLAVVSLLVALDSADFSYLKTKTGATAGNLSVQIEKLRAAGYIQVKKGFKGKMPQTTCRITRTGAAAFEEYVETLREYIEPKAENITDKS